MPANASFFKLQGVLYHFHLFNELYKLQIVQKKKQSRGVKSGGIVGEGNTKSILLLTEVDLNIPLKIKKIVVRNFFVTEILIYLSVNIHMQIIHLYGNK